MPNKSLPPDWFTYIVYTLITALAGVFGAFVMQINAPTRKWTQRVTEWIGGALCAVYGAELVAQALHHMLIKYDFIHPDHIVPEKIIGLAGFLCGAVGVALIDGFIKIIKKYSDHNSSPPS
ncbi:hypothetical protein [Bartonella tamiae]|uniref:hypothetical protein n=1 Tax=Bartonella tamiae TaxID=373638 RepID=UPI00026E779C|nr:hypothetical protein [Bartonella tamiae]EJF92635.1 hypothetical protein MEG_01805 [Bartonella tamiae Th307]